MSETSQFPTASFSATSGSNQKRSIITTAGGPILGIAVVALLFAVPTLQGAFGFSLYYVVFGSSLFIWVALASSWNIFSGYSGYINFGFASFYGAGVYTTGFLARTGTENPPSIFMLIVAGAAVAAVLGLLIGFLLFWRGLAHEIFGLLTFAIAIALGVLVRNVEAIGGEGGSIVLGRIDWFGNRPATIYYLGLGLALIAILVSMVIRRSKFGLGLFAIRDDEKAAQTIGVPNFRYKLTAFTISAALGGAVGALHAFNIGFLEPAPVFGVATSVYVVLMALLGGRSHWIGPVIGAILIFTLRERLEGLGLPEISLLITGALLIFVIIRLKEGVYGKLKEQPLLALAVFTVLLVVLTWTGLLGGFIEALLFSTLITLVYLLIPLDFWRERVPALKGKKA